MKTTTISSKASSFKVFSRLVGFAGGVSSFDKKAALEFSGLLEKTCTTATRSRTIKDVSRVFRWGMERGYLQSDPFAYVKRGSDKNKTREYFITREEYGALLDACSCQRERTLLSLYRIGGLRRGEALLTRWSDIDFAGGRFVVRSPKTENHAGHESRCVPLFPELKEELEAYWEGLAEGAPDLLFPGTSYTGTTRLVSQLVTKARLKKWPRLIQNFRSSRANEILREYGSAAESAWIGHSEATARNHYIHVLDEEYERAAGKVVEKVVEKDNKKWAQIG